MEHDGNESDDDRKMPASATVIHASSRFILLAHLPEDQYQQVLSHLDLSDIMNLSLTSCHMRQLVNATRHLDTITSSTSPSSHGKENLQPWYDSNEEDEGGDGLAISDGAIPPSNSAEYSMTDIESSITAAIATTAAATSGGPSNGNVAATARLLLEPTGSRAAAASMGGIENFHDAYASASSARTLAASAATSQSRLHGNRTNRDDSAIINLVLHGKTIMTEHRLNALLTRFRFLTDLTLRGLSVMGDTFLPTLNHCASAPNLVQLRLFDCRIVPNKRNGGKLELYNNGDKLKSITLTGTIFVPYKQTLSSYVSSTNLSEVTLSGCRLLTDEDVNDMTTRLSKLDTLFLPDCSRLARPIIRFSPSIKKLRFMGCVGLQSLERVCVPNLVELDLSSCPLVRDETIEFLFTAEGNNFTASSTSSSVHGGDRSSVPSSLRQLNLRGCHGLQTPRINSSSLEILDISLCGGLKEVELNCDALKMLQIGKCISLQYLSIDACQMKTLNLSMLPLKRLYIDCKQMTDLKLSGCFAMQNSGVECCKCPSLETLDICGTNLTEDVFTQRQALYSSPSASSSMFPQEATGTNLEDKIVAAATTLSHQDVTGASKDTKKRKTNGVAVAVRMGGQPPLNWHQIDQR